jgi:peptidoglycan/xylan/chitin deacetylase (PgdA/CDA1 family)
MLARPPARPLLISCIVLGLLSVLAPPAQARQRGAGAGRSPSTLEATGTDGIAAARFLPDEQPAAVAAPTPPLHPHFFGGRLPNELGRVLIMEYHRIWNPEAPWQRSPDGFRRDLSRLYSAGFRSVSMEGVLANNIDLPYGTSPVVFTFDDSYVSQLWFAEPGVPAADSAVSIMERFAKDHPGFGAHGVFYITWNTLFGGPGSAGAEKLRYLVDHGFELGNHSMSHPNLGKLSSAAVQQELGQEQALVRKLLDGYEMKTMALPFGAWPSNKDIARAGSWNGQAYQFEAILQVGSEPAPAPASAAYNPLVLPRVQAGEALLSYWLDWFDKHPDERYVSAGDNGATTYPARLQGKLRSDAASRWAVHSYTY